MEVFKGSFLDFMHFLLVYQATTLRNHCLYTEAIMYSAFKTYATISRGWGICSLLLFPPREFATQDKKSANAQGLARGGGGGMGAAGID